MTTQITSLDYFELKAGLSDDQIKAFDKCINWALNIRNKQIKWFVIAGYAGSGKTYLIQRLIPALEQILGSNIGAAAPTNKAVAILDEVCGNLVSISGTIHQFLGLRPSEPDENGKRQLEQGFTKIKIEKFSFVIIDEASMIGSELLKFIPRHVPIILMGDLAQLPPVEDEQEVSPILKNPDVILTEVIRYDGEVANHVFKIRQNLESKWLPRVQTSGNLTKWTNKEQWEQKAFESFRHADKPDDVKMLAWSNREVERLNKLIRNAIYPHHSKQLYAEGELVVAKEPLSIFNGDYREIILRSCQEAEILKADLIKNYPIGIDGTGNSANVWRLILLTTDDTKAEWYAIDSSSIKEVSNFLSLYKKDILDEDDKLRRKKMWAKYYDFCNDYCVVPKGNGLIHRLQYSYALTTHQSQGSTFQKVFVNGCNLFGCQEIKLRNQLLYTAFTRCSDELHVLLKF